MKARIFFVTASLCLALAGCNAGSLSARVGDLSAEQLRIDQRGVVLIHTSLHDEGCQAISANLAKPESGRYVNTGQIITLKGPFDLSKVPAQVTLPAGDYGIVRLRCTQPYNNRSFSARIAQRGSLLDGSGTVYEAPIVTFKVVAGEVTDVGSLRLPASRSRWACLPHKVACSRRLLQKHPTPGFKT